MMEFIIKSAISLGLLYSCFFAFLSRETFHRFNRVCLLLIMLASLTLPFVHINISQPTAVQDVVQIPTVYFSQIPVIQIHPATLEEEPLTWGQLLTYIYLAGVGAMLTLLFVQVMRLVHLMQGGLRHTDNRGNTVILKPSVRSPFSIFHWIVMSVDDYERHRQSILVHEQEHIRLGHTYDLLLLEAMKVVLWFNPFVWLLGHDLRAIHEYEADEAVINQGIDAKQYQQLLVLKAVGNRLQPFANTLRRGSLKQRIIMMYQKKSKRWMMLKALFVIPTMGLALYAFATPEAVPEIQNVLDEKVVLPSKAHTTPQPKEDELILGKDLATLMESESNFNVDYSEEKLDSFRVMALKPEDVLIIDGLEVTLKELNSLKTEDINNITVIKDEESRMQLLKDIILRDREVKKGNAIVIETKEYAKEQGEIDPKPEVLPEFPGGMEKCMQFLMTHLKYPTESQEWGIQGRVMMQFTVKADGSIEDIEPIAIGGTKGKNAKELAEMAVSARKKQAKDNGETEVSEKELEGIRKGNLAMMEESARVIKLMPKWKPAQTGGKAVNCQFVLPITFRLN